MFTIFIVGTWRALLAAGFGCRRRCECTVRSRPPQTVAVRSTHSATHASSQAPTSAELNAHQPSRCAPATAPPPLRSCVASWGLRKIKWLCALIHYLAATFRHFCFSWARSGFVARRRHGGPALDVSSRRPRTLAFAPPLPSHYLVAHIFFLFPSASEIFGVQNHVGCLRRTLCARHCARGAARQWCTTQPRATERARSGGGRARRRRQRASPRRRSQHRHYRSRRSRKDYTGRALQKSLARPARST